MRPIEKLSTDSAQYRITVRDQALSQYVSHGMMSGLLSETSLYYSSDGGYIYCHPSATFEVHGYRVSVSDGEPLFYPKTSGSYYLVLHVNATENDATYTFEEKPSVPSSSDIEKETGDAYLTIASYSYSGGVSNLRLLCDRIGITINDIKEQAANFNSSSIKNSVDNAVSIATGNLRSEMESYCDNVLSEKIDTSLQDGINNALPSMVSQEVADKTSSVSLTASNANAMAKDNATKLTWVRHVFLGRDIKDEVLNSGADGIVYLQISAGEGKYNDKLIDLVSNYPMCKMLICDSESNFDSNKFRGYTPTFIYQGYNQIRIFFNYDVVTNIGYIVVYTQDGNPLKE